MATGGASSCVWRRMPIADYADTREDGQYLPTFLSEERARARASTPVLCAGIRSVMLIWVRERMWNTDQLLLCPLLQSSVAKAKPTCLADANNDDIGGRCWGSVQVAWFDLWPPDGCVVAVQPFLRTVKAKGLRYTVLSMSILIWNKTIHGISSIFNDETKRCVISGIQKIESI